MARSDEESKSFFVFLGQFLSYWNLCRDSSWQI